MSHDGAIRPASRTDCYKTKFSAPGVSSLLLALLFVLMNSFAEDVNFRLTFTMDGENDGNARFCYQPAVVTISPFR